MSPSKNIVVTGATSGLGFELASELTSRGWRVLMHGRNERSAMAAIERLPRMPGLERPVPVWGDLSRLQDVRQLAEQIVKLAPRLDGLVNNAGIFAPSAFSASAQGHELTIAVNQLAPFALTHWVMDSLRAAPRARVINVACIAAQRGSADLDVASLQPYNRHRVYAASKRLLVASTHELSRRLEKTNVTVSSVHPGILDTKLLRAGFKTPGVPPEQGVSAIVRALDSVEGTSWPVDRELEQRVYEQSRALTEVRAL